MSGYRPRPGDVFSAKYQVESVLGRGGMGVVLACRNILTNQPVALKLLDPEVASSPDAVARLLREGQSVTRLRSPHVVRVGDYGTLPNGAPYIAMERLEGNDLSALLKHRGRFSVTEAVAYMLQTCDALAEAHALGIIHRDLKPGNLFITRDRDGRPFVKVLDFGISKVLEATMSEGLTTTSAFLGSPRYVAPEQARSAKRADARSDVWSLGVILHHLVSGSLPFPGDTAPEVLTSICIDPPEPLGPKCPGIPPELEAAIVHALEKEPANRTRSVVAFARSIEQWAPPGLMQSLVGLRQAMAAEGADPAVKLPPSEELAVAVTTSDPWDKTARPVRRSRGLVLGLGAAGLVGVVAAAGAYIHLRAAPAHPVSGSASATSTPPTASSPAAAAASAPAASPSAESTADAAASAHPAEAKAHASRHVEPSRAPQGRAADARPADTAPAPKAKQPPPQPAPPHPGVNGLLDSRK